MVTSAVDADGLPEHLNVADAVDDAHVDAAAGDVDATDAAAGDVDDRQNPSAHDVYY